MSRLWFRRILALCPLVVAILWVGGVAGFRGHPLGPRDYGLLAAAAMALHLIMQRARRPRPLPPLPQGITPVRLALLSATLLGLFAGVVGGVFEWLITAAEPSATPWPLRTVWHAACVFAGSYCTVLHRLTGPTATKPPASPPPTT